MTTAENDWVAEPLVTTQVTVCWPAARETPIRALPPAWSAVSMNQATVAPAGMLAFAWNAIASGAPASTEPVMAPLNEMPVMTAMPAPWMLGGATVMTVEKIWVSLPLT